MPTLYLSILGIRLPLLGHKSLFFRNTKIIYFYRLRRRCSSTDSAGKKERGIQCVNLELKFLYLYLGIIFDFAKIFRSKMFRKCGR